VPTGVSEPPSELVCEAMRCYLEALQHDPALGQNVMPRVLDLLVR
jgi:hypothetical protein